MFPCLDLSEDPIDTHENRKLDLGTARRSLSRPAES
jgi:hypothetical protein